LELQIKKPKSHREIGFLHLIWPAAAMQIDAVHDPLGAALVAVACLTETLIRKWVAGTPWI
jgi:hypothetical protein